MVSGALQQDLLSDILFIYRVTMVEKRGAFVVHPIGERSNIYICATEDEAKKLATEDFRAGRVILDNLQYIVENLGKFEGDSDNGSRPDR